MSRKPKRRPPSWERTHILVEPVAIHTLLEPRKPADLSDRLYHLLKLADRADRPVLVNRETFDVIVAEIPESESWIPHLVPALRGDATQEEEEESDVSYHTRASRRAGPSVRESFGFLSAHQGNAQGA